ncbi:MAG TPA: AI-2E family transporter [Pyrinomonadaceae bacterium]|nr:AI-2E family transporter [Pyrinomonadaceae bacterium]
MPVEASWPPTRIVLRVIIVILLVIGTLWVLYKLTTVILLLVLSVFFAYLVSPLVEIVRRPRYLAGRRIAVPLPAAIAIAYVLIFAGVFLAIYFVIPQLANQYPQFAQQFQGYAQTISGKTQALNEYLRQHRMPDSILQGINSEVPILLGKVGGVAGALVAALAEWVVFLPWLVLIPILSFFMLKDAESFRRSALQMLPRGRWRWRGDEFFQDVNSTLAAYTRAQLTACFFIGAVCATGFAVIRMPSPLVLGLIAGLFEFVPLVGPLLIAILAAVVALLHSGFSEALAVLVFLGVLRILQDYVVYPRLIGHGIHLHALAVIIAILCGEKLAGVAGIFLAIPVVAVVTVTYRHWLEHRGSEGLAEVLQDDLQVVAEDIVQLATAESRESSADSPPKHPTADTTPDEMSRSRPDLTTGELKMPVEE